MRIRLAAALVAPLIALLVVPSRALPAQHAPSADTALARWRVDVGAYVRVSTGDERTTARIIGTDGEHLRLYAARTERRVPVGTIDTLWLRGGSPARGAIMGAAIGWAAAGGLALLYVNNRPRELTEARNRSFADGLRAVAIGTTVGAAAGAVPGAIVGALMPRWRRRHP